MAAGDFVISSKRKVREGEVGANRPVSEAVAQVISGSINGLIDSSFFNIDIHYQGYFSTSSLFNQAPIRIENDCDIVQYALSIQASGSGTANGINFRIEDDSGAFVNNLFGSGADRCFISGNSGTDVLIGRDLDNAQDFATNEAGHTIQYGNLNLTTLQAGYILRPFVENYSTFARSMRFRMRLREQ